VYGSAHAPPAALTQCCVSAVQRIVSRHDARRAFVASTSGAIGDSPRKRRGGIARGVAPGGFVEAPAAGEAA
jgi:hypothetical protein